MQIKRTLPRSSFRRPSQCHHLQVSEKAIIVNCKDDEGRRTLSPCWLLRRCEFHRDNHCECCESEESCVHLAAKPGSGGCCGLHTQLSQRHNIGTWRSCDGPPAAVTCLQGGPSTDRFSVSVKLCFARIISSVSYLISWSYPEITMRAQSAAGHNLRLCLASRSLCRPSLNRLGAGRTWCGTMRRRREPLGLYRH